MIRSSGWGGVDRRALKSSRNASIDGNNCTVRASWFFEQVTVNTFNSKLMSRQNSGGLEYFASPTISDFRQPE